MYKNFKEDKHVLDGLTPELAQQIIAWGVVLALLSNDPENPWITGGEGTATKSGREKGYRTFPPYSVLLFGKWRSYQRIEPFATSVGLAVDWVNSIRSGDPERIAKVPLTSLSSQLRDKTMLSGVSDVLRAVDSEDPAQGVARWSSNFATSWVPNLFRSAGRASDDEVMNRRVWGKGSEWWYRLGKRIGQKSELPGMDYLLPDYPIYDAWGRPAKQSEAWGSDWIYRMVVPIRTKDKEVFVADRLLINMSNRSDEEITFPMSPLPKYTYKGKEAYMTDGQFADFSRLAGEAARKGLEVVPLDADNPTFGDVEWIGDVMSESRKRIRETMVKRWEEGGDMPDTDAVAKESVETIIGRRVKGVVTFSNLSKKKDDETRSDYRKRVEGSQWTKRRLSHSDWLESHADSEVIHSALKAIMVSRKAPRRTDGRGFFSERVKAWRKWKKVLEAGTD